jgi:hypothetical protein
MSWRYETRLAQNVVAEWSSFLLLIREVSSSKLGQETSYPKVFVVFLSILREIPE